MSKPTLKQLLCYETRHWAAGRVALAGVDEVGRGPLAGPVVAAAVILPRRRAALRPLDGLRDSKLLSVHQREHYFTVIGELAEDIGLGLVSARLIDLINIHQATLLAMRRALACLDEVDQLLVDGPWRIPYLKVAQQPIVRGDTLSLSIAAASVVAKVFRDALLRAWSAQYPAYHLAENKGYGTADHRQAILAHGLSPLHRRSFCRKILAAGAAHE